MYTCVRTSTVGTSMPVPPVAFAMSCLAHMPHGQCPQTLCFRLMPIAMQGGSNPPLPPDVPFVRVLVQSRVMCVYPIRGASSPGTHTPIFGTWPSAMCRQPESRPAMSFTDHRVGLVVCRDATSAGHLTRSTMPLRRVIGSKLDGATSAGHRSMCGSTSPHVGGARTRINDATSAGHRIRSTVPLQRVTGSFSSSLSIPASIERWTACRERLGTGCQAWSFYRQTHFSK